MTTTQEADNLAKFKKMTAENIEHFGQSVVGVFPAKGEKGPEFYYTIGNTGRGLPELLVLGGFPPDIVTNLLNTISARQAETLSGVPEGEIDIGWSVPFKIVRASEEAKKRYSVQVGQYYQREDYELLQVLLQDKDGHYQDDERCAWGVLVA